jgi:hypothetical protein
VHPSDGQRLKINKIDDQSRKRYADHRWVDHEEEEDHGYVWQKGIVVPTWFKEKPEEKGAALEESGTEAGRNQKETSVAPKRQT